MNHELHDVLLLKAWYFFNFFNRVKAKGPKKVGWFWSQRTFRNTGSSVYVFWSDCKIGMLKTDLRSEKTFGYGCQGKLRFFCLLLLSVFSLRHFPETNFQLNLQGWLIRASFATPEEKLLQLATCRRENLNSRGRFSDGFATFQVKSYVTMDVAIPFSLVTWILFILHLQGGSGNCLFLRQSKTAKKKNIWFRRPSERMCRGVKHLPCFLCRDSSPPSR